MDKPLFADNKGYLRHYLCGAIIDLDSSYLMRVNKDNCKSWTIELTASLCVSQVEFKFLLPCLETGYWEYCITTNENIESDRTVLFEGRFRVYQK